MREEQRLEEERLEKERALQLAARLQASAEPIKWKIVNRRGVIIRINPDEEKKQ